MADDIVYRYPDAKAKITILDVADTGICSELILELNGKLQAEGFRTLRITDVNQAVHECCDWVNERIRYHFPIIRDVKPERVEGERNEKTKIEIKNEKSKR